MKTPSVFLVSALAVLYATGLWAAEENICPAQALVPENAAIGLSATPSDPSYDDQVNVEIRLQDLVKQKIELVVLYYKYNVESEFNKFIMMEPDEAADGLYHGVIPAMPPEKREVYRDQKSSVALEYYVIVVDSKGRQQQVYGTADLPVCLPLLKERLDMIEDATIAGWDTGATDKPVINKRKRNKHKQVDISKGLPVLPSYEDIMMKEFQLISGEAEVTSASKGRLKLRESPSAITVLNANDIHNYGSHRIVDVLRMVPGMDFMTLSNSDHNLSIRGFNREGANKLLVLVDGRSVYVDLFGITFWDALPIPVDDIKRIEVIRGPGSSLYGANAFSGVVNIFTNRPRDLEGIKYSFTYDRYNIVGSAVTGGTTGNLGYKVSTSYVRGYDFEDVNSLALESVKGNVYLETDIDSIGLHLSIASGLSRDNAGTIFSLIGPVAPEATQAYAQFNAEWKHGNHRLSLQTYWNGLDLTIRNSFPLPKSLSIDMSEELGFDWTENIDISDLIGPVDTSQSIAAEGHVLDTELQYTLTYLGKNRLIGGIEYRAYWFDSPDLIDPSTWINNMSLYAQNEWWIVDNLVLNTGVRFDLQDVKENKPKLTWSNDEEKEAILSPDPTKPFPTEDEEIDNIYTFSPRAALVYSPSKNHSLRVSFGSAFRNPAYFEAYMQVPVLGQFTPDSDTLSTTSDGRGSLLYLANVITADQRAGLAFRGRPGMKPERLLSFEFGYAAAFFNERLAMHLDYFFNMVSGLILFQGREDLLVNYILNGDSAVRDGRTKDIFSFSNNIDANNTGFEYELRWQITNWLKFVANYSFQYIWVPNKNDVIKQFVANFNRDYENENLQIEADDVDFDRISTVEKENPMHKANFGLNFSYIGISANTYVHLVSGTERLQFLSRLPSYEHTIVATNPFSGDPLIVSKRMSDTSIDASGKSQLYAVTDIPLYVLWNFNISYTMFEGRLEIGTSLTDLLHFDSLWKNVGNYGFTSDGTGIQSPRYIQYPRMNLFGNVMGGDVLPASVSFFIKGTI